MAGNSGMYRKRAISIFFETYFFVELENAQEKCGNFEKRQGDELLTVHFSDLMAIIMFTSPNIKVHYRQNKLFLQNTNI